MAACKRFKTSLSTEEVIQRIFQDSDSDDCSEYDTDDDNMITASDSPDSIEMIHNINGGDDGAHTDIALDAVSEIEWERYPDEDPFDSCWLTRHRGRPSVLVDTSGYCPVDFFKLFFPNSAIELMCSETNIYAEQYFDNPVELGRQSRFWKWKDTNFDEMSVKIAIEISMGLCSKPTIAEYWNQFWLTRTNVASLMSRNRYQLLQTFLHFADNSDRIERGQPGYNPLFKIQKLFDIVTPLYERIFSPGPSLSVDESMTKFKGRVFFRQYMPKKPVKWGMKSFVLCDSKTGYALKHIVYTGKSAFAVDTKSPFSFTEQVVLNLLSGYEHSGQTVYTDSFYSSPNLYRELERRGIGASGTVNSNRKNMPSELKPKHLSLCKGDDAVFCRSGNLVACAWHDTKRVTLLSTVSTNNTIDKQIRSRETPTGKRLVEKPVIADVYNANMGGVDVYDQCMKTYCYPHKSQKWYQPLYHAIVETALVNGYIIYKQTRKPDERVMTTIQFRKSIISSLVENYDHTNIEKCAGRNSEGRPNRLIERHFVKRFENTKHRPECKVCGSLRPKIRRQTSYWCKNCETPLCVVPCFEIFHTMRDFQRARERYDTEE